MRVTKGYLLDDMKDKDILDYLEKIDNQSSYIRKLIRNDMKGKNTEEVISRLIETKLKEYLENYQIGSIKKEEIISKDDIKGVLDMQ